MSFQVGDVVVLANSSGPCMTVVGAPRELDGRKFIPVCWFTDRGEFKSKRMALDTLQSVPL